MNQFSRIADNGHEPSRPTSVGPLTALKGQAPTTSLAKHLDGMRVAIVHHWFLSRAGGERVFDSIASMFPTADVFTLLVDKKYRWALTNQKITASFLDRIPGAKNVHRHL